MYFPHRTDLTYEEWWTYLWGVDAGSERRFLRGFNEFVEMLYGGYGEHGAYGLVRWMAVGRDAPRPLNPGDDRSAVDKLLELLDEFLAEVEGSGSRDRIMKEHLLWKLDRYSRGVALHRPPGKIVPGSTAAEMLGISRRDVFDLIAQCRLSAYRVGADVMLRSKQVSEFDNT